ncbi:MAG: GIY-YIG nuclease family protein [Candidatus Kerfeldbacteria bacterium]|nr:GIY-YIG nuclease family protein [Candidatus Kerfeldbacteria bacterium]
MKYYVYILKSPNCRRYYIGSSSDLNRRLGEHNDNLVKATKNKGPWQIIFSQKFDTQVETRRIELWLKKMKSRILLEKIINDGRVIHSV